MLLIKNLFRILLFVPFLSACIIFLSCNSDTTDEEPISAEPEVEDFANFAEDSLFRKHMENTAITTSRITDYNKALELLEAPELNDMQQIELAKALGFENIELTNTVYDLLNKEWEKLTLRFDLLSQDASVIDNMLFKTLLEVRYNQTGRSKTGKEYTNEEVHCFYEVCGPPRLATLEPFTIAMEKCYAIDDPTGEDRSAYLECSRKTRQRFSLLLRQAEIDWVCCISSDECDIGDDPYPTVEGGTPFDYSLCSDIPIG
ncbi:hypothetical protein [Aquimarina celericrescens]|uniref:Lipoprotein n=1 Tax=Aquimarina celericrescens TaxID=1964542 RepID=A0ABW5B061_9FLAO|nr:hypothetical protein [Aquimarina celericrescens]